MTPVLLLVALLFRSPDSADPVTPHEPPSTVTEVPIEAHCQRYPSPAIHAGMKGTVIISVSVDSGGVVQANAFLKRINPLLDKAALDAAIQWRFRPSDLNERHFDLKFDFALEESVRVSRFGLLPAHSSRCYSPSLQGMHQP